MSLCMQRHWGISTARVHFHPQVIAWPFDKGYPFSSCWLFKRKRLDRLKAFLVVVGKFGNIHKF